MKVSSGSQSAEDALECLRKAMVGALRHGKTLVINVDNLRPNFRVDYKGDVLPEWVWDYQTLFNDAVKLVKEDENTDCMGSTPYHIIKTFALVILCTFTNDEDVASYQEKFPHGGDFKKYIIQ